MKLTLWHGSIVRINRFDPRMPIDGGFHCGSEAQARMRNATWLHEVTADIRNPRRSRDTGSGWKAKISSARSSGHDCIIYLNRYEGLSADIIQRLSASGDLDRLDTMTDAEIRKLVPEATDSYLLFDPVTFNILSATMSQQAADEPPAPVQDQDPQAP